MSRPLNLLPQLMAREPQPTSSNKLLLSLTLQKLLDEVNEISYRYYASVMVVAIICTPLEIVDPQVLLPHLLEVQLQPRPMLMVPYSLLLPGQHAGRLSPANISTGPNGEKLTLSEIALKIAETETGVAGLLTTISEVSNGDATAGGGCLQKTLAVVVTVHIGKNAKIDHRPEVKWVGGRARHRTDG